MGGYATNQDPATILFAAALPGSPTAGTAGEALKFADVRLDAAVTTRMATFVYTTPPTAAAIATAVWTTTTGGDFTTLGSPGHILVSQLGGTFTANNTAIFSTAALANAPGGSLTVADIWGEPMAAYTTPGTAGADLAAAGTAADPWSTLLPGGYTAGMAGAILGGVLKANLKQVNDVNILTPVIPGVPVVDTTYIHGVGPVDLSSSGVTLAAGEYNAIADAALKRDWTAVDQTALPAFCNWQAFRVLRNGFETNQATKIRTIFKEDKTTPAWTSTVSTVPAAEPIIGDTPT